MLRACKYLAPRKVGTVHSTTAVNQPHLDSWSSLELVLPTGTQVASRGPLQYLGA